MENCKKIKLSSDEKFELKRIWLKPDISTLTPNTVSNLLNKGLISINTDKLIEPFELTECGKYWLNLIDDID